MIITRNTANNPVTTKGPLADLMCNDITLASVLKIIEEHYTEAAQHYWTIPIQLAAHAHTQREARHYILGFTINRLRFYPDSIEAVCTDDYNNYTLVLTGFDKDKIPDDVLVDIEQSPVLGPSNIVVYLKRHLDNFFQSSAYVRIYQDLEEPNVCPDDDNLTFMFKHSPANRSFNTELRVYFERKI